MLNDNGWLVPDRPTDRTPVTRRIKGAKVIDRALRHCRNRRGVVVQAGGHMGYWPWRLAQWFSVVHTFEPCPESWPCLVANLGAVEIEVGPYPVAEAVSGRARILAGRAALGQAPSRADLVYSRKSTGCHWMHHADEGMGDTPVVSIDSLGIKPDAIFLDIEGAEIDVIRGAAETIERCRPLIVAEENHCCERYGYRAGDLAALLKTLGYRRADRFKYDHIFTSC